MEGEGTAVDAVGGGSLNLKNPVEIFLGSLEKICRNMKVFAHDQNAMGLVSQYDAAYEACNRAFIESPEIKITVKAFDMHYDRKIVYTNKDRKGSLSYALYQDGIRLIVLRQGITREEVVEVAHILATDMNHPDNSDQDFYCLFAERELPHFEVVAGDIGQEWKKKDPALEQSIEDFYKSVTVGESNKVQPSTQPRRLPAKDKEVIESFKLNPSHFERNEEDVSRIIQMMSKSSDHSKREKETLERLLAMGFHLLSDKEDQNQLQLGRDLVVKVTLMILQAHQLDTFRGVTQKLSSDKSPLNSEIIAGIFDSKNLPLFGAALDSTENQAEVAQALEACLPASLRTIVHLLGKYPIIGKTCGDAILRSFNVDLAWLVEDVAQDPDNDSWPLLVHLFSEKPNPHLQKFLELLLKSPKLTLRLKVLKQLATVGTPEALQNFVPMLRSKREDERLQAYELLRVAHNKLALKMLKDQFESPQFAPMASTEERESIYSGIFSIAGESSLPWFEALWLQKEGGLFSAKPTLERRTSLFKALSRVSVAHTQKLFERLPAGEVPKEMREHLDRMAMAQNRVAKT